MRQSAIQRYVSLADLDASLTRSLTDSDEVSIIEKPAEVGWWDWAVFLLHTAAEIEHVLMVQYLYAAYSLAESDFAGSNVPEEASGLTASWRDTIITVAREEMAHLLTEQNLLRFIEGPLNLEREDFPFRSALYPFPLSLEPLTRSSLAKYVVAEMPADPDVPDLQEIIAKAQASAGGMRPNRVGIIFDTLIDVFSDEARLTEADFRPATADSLQATPGDWFVFGEMVVRTIRSRQEAKDAIRLVGEQGEGTGTPSESPSHFDRFLEIYRAFPETEDVADPAWVPTRPVPVDPTTAADPLPDPSAEASRISHPVTRLWAQLFNVRYRMVLADLSHALHLDGPYEGAGGLTPRGELRNWTFAQMRWIRSLAQELTERPAKPDAGVTARAGPPFELPYTMSIPDTEHGRWRLHLALLDATTGLVAALRQEGETSTLLDSLETDDEPARTLVQQQLANG